MVREKAIAFLSKYKKNIKNFNDSQSKELLLAAVKKMMLKDNMIKFFIQNRNSFNVD